ncbi:MAG: hypothetical protein PHE55_02730 [Methylococcaceae bacterium]|nr:hypothetical protein [Methylococcaceae bacterium]
MLTVIGLFALVIGGELLLPVLDTLALVVFESFEMGFDTLYEEVFEMDDDHAQKATAWTATLIYVVAGIWAVKKLYRKYQQAKAAAPLWWVSKKAELKVWWKSLNWKQKLAHIAGGLVLLGLLVLFL